MKTNTLWLNLLIILSMSNHTVIQSENQKHSRMCRVYHFGYMHAQPFFTGAFAGSWLGFKLGNTLNFSPRAQTATSLFGALTGGVINTHLFQRYMSHCNMTIKHQQKKEDEMIITNQKELLKELLQEKAAQQKEYAIVIAKQEELLEEKRGISALQKELLAGKDLIIANRNSDIADLKVLLSGHIASQNSALDSALEKLQKQLQGPLSVHSPLHQ